jgi:hypothetical protein
MTFRPRHLSVSSVQLYATCPAQWKARYVDRLVTPSNPPMLFGKAFHAALEAEHRGENSERALIAAWNAADSDLAASGQVMHPGKAHALALLDEYKARGLGGKLGRPECKFMLMLPTPNVPVPVLGYIDLPIPEQHRFREFKTTSGSTWTDTKVALEHQLHVYGWAYQRTYNHRVTCAEYVIFSTVSPSLYVIEAVPSPDGFRLFEMQAEATWQGIVAGNFDGCGACELCKPSVERPSNGPTFAWDEAAS